MNRQIDGIHVLRAIAATMVVACHSRITVTGEASGICAAGVDIFFVISGYVMALTTQKLPAENLAGNFRQGASFFWKRILRIVPLYWVAIIWVGRRQLTDPHLIQDFLFIPRLNPAIPGMIRPILTPGWTLNFEMAFYTIFAVAMLFGRARYLLIAVGLLGLVMVTQLGLSGTAATFYSDSIALEFGLGILLYYLVRDHYPDWSRSTFSALMATGFSLLILGWGREPRVIALGLPALLIVWSSFKACEGWLRIRPLVLMGDASYAIYLFHWPSFGLLKPVVRLIGPNHNAVLILAHVGVGVVAGIGVHLTLEKWLKSATDWIREKLASASWAPTLEFPRKPVIAHCDVEQNTLSQTHISAAT